MRSFIIFSAISALFLGGCYYGALELKDANHGVHRSADNVIGMR